MNSLNDGEFLDAHAYISLHHDAKSARLTRPSCPKIRGRVLFKTTVVTWLYFGKFNCVQCYVVPKMISFSVSVIPTKRQSWGSTTKPIYKKQEFIYSDYLICNIWFHNLTRQSLFLCNYLHTTKICTYCKVSMIGYIRIFK